MAAPFDAPTVHSYATFMDNNDPFGGNFASLFIPYAQVENYTPAQVRTLVANARSNNISTALLQYDDRGVLNVFLQPERVEEQMGLPPTGQEGNILAQYGELLPGHQAVVVHIPNDSFNATAGVRVPLPATIASAVAADPNVTLVGPYVEDVEGADPVSEVVRGRKIVPIPPPFIAASLARRNIKPIEMWNMVYPRCVAEGWLESCAPFLNFLRCAMTRSVEGESPVVTVPGPRPILLDRVMAERRNRIIHNDFPPLHPALGGLQQDQLAQTLGAMRGDFQARHAAEELRRAAEKVKTIADKFGTEMEKDIMILTQSQCLEQVNIQAPLWSKLAGAPKSQHLSILQKSLDKMKKDMNEQGLQLIASPSILNTITTLALEMVDNDAIKTGLNPFRFHEEENEVQARNNQAVYNMTHGGGGAPSLTDAADLVQPTAQAPVALHQARQMITRNSIYAAVCLGIEHPLVDSLIAWKLRFTAMESRLHVMMAEEPLLPSLLVKRVAISGSNWFKGQLQQVHLYPVPVFADVFDKIENEEYWKPMTSPSFLRALGLPATAGPPSIQGPPTVPRAPAAPRVPRAPTAPTNPSADHDGLVFVNTNFNPIFQTYQASRTGCRALRDRIENMDIPEADRLPKLPDSRIGDGKPMCLAFHAKGVCNPNCGRIADHVPYTTAQYQGLKQWCADHWSL